MITLITRCIVTTSSTAARVAPQSTKRSTRTVTTSTITGGMTTTGRIMEETADPLVSMTTFASYGAKSSTRSRGVRRNLTLHVAVTGASRGFGRAIAVALCQPDNYFTYRGTTDDLPFHQNNRRDMNHHRRSNTTSIRPRHINAVFVARSASGLHALSQQILQNHTESDTNNTGSPSADCKNHTNLVIPFASNEELVQGQETTQPNISSTIQVSTVVADLGNIHTIDTIIDRTLQYWEEHQNVDHLDIKAEATSSSTNVAQKQNEAEVVESTLEEDKEVEPQVERYIFINNVGSLGHIGSCDTYTSVHDMNAAMTLNVTNSLWFTTRVVQWVKQQHQQQQEQRQQTNGNDDDGCSDPNTTNKVLHLTIVNISSLVAIQSFPSLATYSATKAARDMYHNGLAKEVGTDDGDDDSKDNVHQQEPDMGDDVKSATRSQSPKVKLRILNYAPGPLRTDMTTELQNHVPELHPSIRPFYDTQNENDAPTFIDPMDSANVLMGLLLEDTFVNGAHVDYYDCI